MRAWPLLRHRNKCLWRHGQDRSTSYVLRASSGKARISNEPGLLPCTVTKTCGAVFAATSRRIRRGELTGKPPFTTSAFVVESSMATKTRRLMAPGTIGMSGSRRARSGKSRTLCLRVGTWLSNFATFRQGSYEIGGCRSQAQSKTKSLVSTTVSTEKYEPGPFDFCLLHISFCPENELGSSEKCEPGPFCANIGGHFGAVLLGKRMDIGLLILGLRLGCLNLRAVYELKASLAPFICIAIPGETLPIKWT
jgi:hypothetical protein